MNQIAPASFSAQALLTESTHDYVTAVIGNQLFGIPVLTVRDVLGPQRITRVPLSPPEVAGALNLRGRIVACVDARPRFGLPPADGGDRMNVVVENKGELFSIVVDQVGEVLHVPLSSFEANPPTLEPRWREFSLGIHRLKDRLMIILDVQRLLDLRSE